MDAIYDMNQDTGEAMFTNLETQRLTLRCIDHSDRDFIFKEFQSEFINRYLFDEEPMTDISQADQLIEFYTMSEPRMQNRWVLVDKITGEKLGTCGYHFWKPDLQEVEIGFELMEAFNGKGYMLEAVETILAFARQQMQVKTIRAVVYQGNTKCIQLLEKLQFVKVGDENTEFDGKSYLHDVYALKI